MKNPTPKDGVAVRLISKQTFKLSEPGPYVLERRGMDMYLNGILVGRGIANNADLSEEIYGRGLDYDDEMRKAWEGWQ